MNQNIVINGLSKLGLLLREKESSLSKMIRNKIFLQNAWFSNDSINFCLNHWSSQLRNENIIDWISKYDINNKSKNILLITASNIPLVGLHDFLCILLTGNIAVIKPSSRNNILLTWLLDKLCEVEPKICKHILYVKNLNDKIVDGVIASGSNNTSLYLNYIFSNNKRLIRNNRKSIAIINGNEDEKELKRLADDIFIYYGLGCRNVSQLFLPANFNLERLQNCFSHYKHIMLNEKYSNNYNYYKTIFEIKGIAHVDCKFYLLVNSNRLNAPPSVLNFSYYNDIKQVDRFVKENQNNIQCIVSKSYLNFGLAQRPKLSSYMDNVDTIDFINKI